MKRKEMKEKAKKITGINPSTQLLYLRTDMLRELLEGLNKENEELRHRITNLEKRIT